MDSESGGWENSEKAPESRVKAGIKLVATRGYYPSYSHPRSEKAFEPLRSPFPENEFASGFHLSFFSLRLVKLCAPPHKMVVSEEWVLQWPQTRSPHLTPLPRPPPANSAIPARRKPRGGVVLRRTLAASFRQLKGYGEAVARAEGRGGC